MSVCFSVCEHADPSSVMRLLVDRQAGSSRQEKKAAAELKADNLLGPNHHQPSQEHLLLPLGPQDTRCNMQDHEEPGHMRRTRGRQWSLRTLIWFSYKPTCK